MTAGDGATPGGDWSRLFESLPIGAYRSTPDGRLLRANPALVRMNGYASEAELVHAVRDAATEWYVERGRRAELLARLARDGAVSGFVSEVRRHRGGERMWVSESATVVRDADGRPLHYEGTVEEITEQVRARQSLERIEAHRRQLSDQLPGMLYRVRVAPDGRQQFEYVSAGVERVYGVSVDEVMRDASVLSRMRHPDDSAAVDAALGAAHAGAAPHSAEFRVLHRDGSLRWVHMLSVPVAEEPGGDVRTGIVLDLTERHQAQQLREERDRAEARRRATSALMSRISHELRTPLNAVLGFAQLLEHEHGLAENQRAWVTHIVDSGRHLLALVEDVLDLARVDGGELVLRPADADVAEAVQANWAMLAAAAAAAEVTLCPLPVTLPRVHADPLRLRQVLGNLLSNAIKYNRRGGEVRLAGERRGGEVGISVCDTGAGLGAAQIERLFLPFERLGAEHGPVSGTGLGLALSRQLAQAMGGRIEVQSTPGQGSCFTVWLPAADGSD
jgi:PAS domain S-box-containing protein